MKPHAILTLLGFLLVIISVAYTTIEVLNDPTALSYDDNAKVCWEFRIMNSTDGCTINDNLFCEGNL